MPSDGEALESMNSEEKEFFAVHVCMGMMYIILSIIYTVFLFQQVKILIGDRKSRRGKQINDGQGVYGTQVGTPKEANDGASSGNVYADNRRVFACIFYLFGLIASVLRASYMFYVRDRFNHAHETQLQVTFSYSGTYFYFICYLDVIVGWFSLCLPRCESCHKTLKKILTFVTVFITFIIFVLAALYMACAKINVEKMQQELDTCSAVFYIVFIVLFLILLALYLRRRERNVFIALGMIIPSITFLWRAILLIVQAEISADISFWNPTVDLLYYFLTEILPIFYVTLVVYGCRCREDVQKLHNNEESDDISLSITERIPLNSQAPPLTWALFQ